MEFNRAHSVVPMKVEDTRVEDIPTTTVDHVYDGEGYGLILKVEREPAKEKSNVVVQDVNSTDDSMNEDAERQDNIEMGLLNTHRRALRCCIG
jgi:hypothetical protein